MARDSKYSPEELQIRGQLPAMFGPPMDVYTTPITPKENTLLLYQGKTPMWAPFPGVDNTHLMLDCDPENVARSPRKDMPADTPIKDGYGVEWIFVEVAGGAMVKPGNPICPDITEWEEYVTIPDPDTWDWAGCYERNKDKLSPERCTYIAVPGCLFERLIAILDFSEAAVALIDDEQKEAVHRFLRKVTDVHKKFYTLAKKWFNADIVNFNDDWGSQRAEFFSEETCREMLLPYVKELVDHVHSLGMYWDLHCCGFVEGFVPLFIEAGEDSWGGQPLNDKWKLKQMYGDKFIFTDSPKVAPDATEEELDAAVADFMQKSGADNRILLDVREPRLRKKLYEATRKNYDRLVAEGKAIF